MSSKAVAETEACLNEPCLRNWLEIPRELTASILLRLGVVEIMKSVENVCTQWRNICKDPSMWRSIDISRIPYGMSYDTLQKMCMHAVDRSRGGLVDLSIWRICTDELLAFITQRHRIWFSYQDDEDALAIAYNMHGLIHLRLQVNSLTNEGLEAILYGCPYLEILDLRGCANVYLEGDVGKRCAEQIKILRHSLDSDDVDYRDYIYYHVYDVYDDYDYDVFYDYDYDVYDDL